MKHSRNFGLLLIATACTACSSAESDGGGTMGSGTGVLPPASSAGAGAPAAPTAGSPAVDPGMVGSAGSGGAMVPPTTPPVTGMAGAMAPAGVAGSGGAMALAGSGATMPPPDPSTCAPAPDGAPQLAIDALAAINSARLAAGAGCVNMVAAINDAALNHCEYYTGNTGDCVSNPHMEVASCMGFTGAGPGDRMNAAGYSARWGGGEVMAFLGDPQGAVDTWINSVWHRLPMLDPWTMDMGYGSAGECDTMDFGSGGDAPEDSVLVYPYDGQLDVPTSFNGQYEGPMPPAPATGWPSASPITVYARDMVITEHVLTVDGDTTPIDHVWLTGDDPEYANFLRQAIMMYGNATFQANTKYRVKIVGTYVGGALEREWTFTTGDPPPMWGNWGG